MKGKWEPSVIGKNYLEIRPSRPSLDSRHKFNASKTELIKMTPFLTDKTTSPKSPKHKVRKERYGNILML